ncbi:hypothetical protein CWI75_01825 [Kineobactrum sediminis]|uniref:HTH araC/xylS-type domain-containing protein n=1 Tax=Kineobactrum sediminis TaxID=1905677 RepID=A0A2N5Y6T7_9GAMM|nr:AraC family transcriptional regulator [Kineobactrum sediminis]PLW84114.1 hypothetical protein CWI75_01825 [Kineobactrum sediminis]
MHKKSQSPLAAASAAAPRATITAAPAPVLREFVDALLAEYAAGTGSSRQLHGGALSTAAAQPLPAGSTYSDSLALYQECITALSERANREGNLPPMRKDEVDMLCFCVISCSTLRGVIERAGRFCAMLGGRGAVLSLRVQAETAHFHMTTQRVNTSVSALLTDLFGLAFYRRLFSWLIGENIPVSGYRVLETEVMDRQLLERVFQQPIAFDQGDNSFSFPARVLDRPVVRGPAALEEVLSVLPFDQMFDPGGHWQFSDTVANIIDTQLVRNERIPSLEQIAGFFNTSPATFHRRLTQEGTSYAAIKRLQRLRRATELLCQEDGIKIDDIAGRLGFSDARSFRRAFADWTGLTPQVWRDRRQPAPPGSV